MKQVICFSLSFKYQNSIPVAKELINMVARSGYHYDLHYYENIETYASVTAVLALIVFMFFLELTLLLFKSSYKENTKQRRWCTMYIVLMLHCSSFPSYVYTVVTCNEVKASIPFLNRQIHCLLLFTPLVSMISEQLYYISNSNSCVYYFSISHVLLVINDHRLVKSTIHYITVIPLLNRVFS